MSGINSPDEIKKKKRNPHKGNDAYHDDFKNQVTKVIFIFGFRGCHDLFEWE